MIWAILTACLLAGILIARAWIRWLVKPCLSERVDLASAFQFTRPIVLRASDRYFLELIVERGQRSFESLRVLMGGVPAQKIEVDGRLVDLGDPTGVVVPIRWSLANSAGPAVSGEGSGVVGSNSWSRREVGRLLYSGDVGAGKYVFSASLAGGLKEFAGVPTRIQLGVDPLHSTSRLVGSCWLAMGYVAAAPWLALGTGLLALWTLTR